MNDNMWLQCWWWGAGVVTGCADCAMSREGPPHRDAKHDLNLGHVQYCCCLSSTNAFVDPRTWIAGSRKHDRNEPDDSLDPPDLFDRRRLRDRDLPIASRTRYGEIDR